MTSRILLALLSLSLLFPGCSSPEKKQEKEKKKEAAARKATSMADPAGDMSYEAFLNRLRGAAQRRDRVELAALMTPLFGYDLDLDAVPPEVVFTIWEERGLWPELIRVVNSQFAPYDQFMVAPPEFAEDPTSYNGYRAGIQRVRGSWKFVYFAGGHALLP